MTSARLRVWQVRRAIGSRPTADDIAFAELHLPPLLRTLFSAASPRDQRHSVAAARWLISQGQKDRDLVQAALLHDCSKGRQSVPERVAFVLLDRDPITALLARQGRGPLAALGRSARHAEESAELARRAGAGEEVVRLIRLHHVAPPPDERLAWLQRADDVE